jgi:GNAT superfamily N-acetyltransferase
MERVECPAQYLTLAAEIKSGSTAFTSNCYAEPQLIEKWAADGRLSIVTTPGAGLLLLHGFRVLHLFHTASDNDALRHALVNLDNVDMADPVAADLIGFPHAIDQTKQIYAASGFNAYRCLLRMTRPGPTNDFMAAAAMFVEDADKRRCADVRDFLLGLLDPFSEQIPFIDDLEVAAEQGRILTVTENGAIAGVLIFSAVGLSSTLRYWFVHPSARGKGIGAALMGKFLHRMADARRIVLWVFSDNEDTICKYRHYGFKIDGLQDSIMLKTPRKRY